MSNTLRYIAIGTGLALIATTIAFAVNANATEKPNYSVLREDGKFEVRSYPPMLLAEVTVDGDRDQAANAGFRKLAGFIFGDNQAQGKIAMTSPVVQTPAEETAPSQKIAMTSPVVQTPTENGRWVVNFMMPSKFTAQTLPAPNDPDIRIYESTPYETVSLRFNGTAKAKNLRKNLEKLDAYVAAQNLQTTGSHEYAFYDAPFIPGFLRRNEVHYRLK